jgi:hypothetical protein
VRNSAGWNQRHCVLPHKNGHRRWAQPDYQPIHHGLPRGNYLQADETPFTHFAPGTVDPMEMCCYNEFAGLLAIYVG